MKKLLVSFGIFPCILFVALCVLAFLIPPFQKSDEPVHFFRAMTVASGQFQCKTTETGRKEFILPKVVYDFPTALAIGDVIMQKDNKFAIGLLKKSYPYKAQSTDVTHEFMYCALPAIAYIPQAFAARVLAPFNNLLFTFYGMRAMSLIIFFFAFLFSYQLIASKFRPFLMLFALLPMVLHQATAVSYDAIHISLAMIAISFFIRLLYQDKKTWKSWAVFVCILMLMNLTKGGYYLTMLLPFFVFPKKISVGKRLMISLSVLILGSVVVAVSFPEKLYGFVSNMSVQQWFVFSDPIHFVSVLFNTVLQDGTYYIKGTLGIFGWLDYELPFFYYLLIASAIGIVLYTIGMQERKPLPIMRLLLLTAVALSNVVLIFFHFYVAATPIGYFKVVGMQGRYFLPLLPLLFYLIVQWIAYMKRFQTFAILLCGMIIIFVLGFSVYDRYYNYQTFFSNPETIEQDLRTGRIQPTSLSVIPMNQPIQVYIDVEQGKKVSGFQMLLDHQKTTTALYAYTLKDEHCTVVLQSGYLDRIIGTPLSHLKQDGELPYTQLFPITSMNTHRICLTITPMNANEKSIYLSTFGEEATPIIQLLYVRQ